MTQSSSKIRQALPDQPIESLIEHYGVSYSLGGSQYLRLPFAALIPSQTLPFEIEISPSTLRHLPPRAIETKITADAGWKSREIPILMELSRLFGHPSTAADTEVRSRLWEFDDHLIYYNTYPKEGRHLLRIERSAGLYKKLEKEAVIRAAKVDTLEIGIPEVSFEFQSFHRWLEETLKNASPEISKITASKNASTFQLSTPAGVLEFSSRAQASIVLRDFGNREDVLGYNLFITLQNPLGGFPQFVEASFCTCPTPHLEALRALGKSLTDFWSIPLREEITIARY